VIQKKEKLERLYLEFVESGASREREKEVFGRFAWRVAHRAD
jgi:hypothetical protein